MASNRDTKRHIEALAFAILEETRAATLVALRFMGPALYAMPFVSAPLKHAILATDGRRCGFNATEVIRVFKDDPNELIRAYLHLVLHCVYRHPFDAKHPRRTWWDIACDATVGVTVLELVGKRFACKGDEARYETLVELQSHFNAITANKVYHAIAVTKNGGSMSDGALPPDLVTRLETLFAADDHGPWPRRAPKVDDAVRAKRRPVASDFIPSDMTVFDDEPSDDGNGPLTHFNSPSGTNAPNEPDDRETPSPIQEEDDDAPFDWLDEPEDLTPDFDFDPALWDEIAKQIESDLKDRRGNAGFNAETFTVSLNLAHRRRFDYRQFLRRFASISEEVKTSPDEFDYIYYNHGLTLYHNMPLIEPLEYQERSRVRDFVVAVDTSASCSGDLVRSFVERTYNILKSADGFGDDINVHIVQCDDEIRDVLKVENVDDLDAYFRHFKMSGMGNTDFRPVFDYVDNAIASQEFKNLKGIIYLTDGEGEYPIYRPRYDAVFLFVEPNPAFLTRVPPWAMKAVMDGDQIVEL